MHGADGGFSSCFYLRHLVRVGSRFLSFLDAELSRFVHERGYRTAIFNLGVLGGINLAVPIGKILFHMACNTC